MNDRPSDLRDALYHYRTQPRLLPDTRLPRRKPIPSPGPNPGTAALPTGGRDQRGPLDSPRCLSAAQTMSADVSKVGGAADADKEPVPSFRCAGCVGSALVGQQTTLDGVSEGAGCLVSTPSSGPPQPQRGRGRACGARAGEAWDLWGRESGGRRGARAGTTRPPPVETRRRRPPQTRQPLWARPLCDPLKACEGRPGGH